MTHKERILRHLHGETVDRIPSVGGWIMGARNLAAIGGLSVDAYLADPEACVLRAYRRLGVDGMIPYIVPRDVDEMRTGSLQEADHAGTPPEALLARAEAIPADEEGGAGEAPDRPARAGGRVPPALRRDAGAAGRHRAHPQFLGRAGELLPLLRIRLPGLPGGRGALPRRGGAHLVGERRHRPRPQRHHRAHDPQVRLRPHAAHRT